MFFPEYYSKLDPSYREALGKLESVLEDRRSDKSQNALMDFAGKYTMSPVLWKGFSNCCPNFERPRLSKCYERTTSGEIVVLDDLLYPNSQLDKMEEYERNAHSFIPRDVYRRNEEMKELYLKIKSAEGDLDEWFAALLEANDHQFVCDNVEIRLEKDLTDRKLWKKYINYLKEYDFKLLLETYSKYVRFFTDDIEMMQEYRQAAVKYNAPISIPWKNPFHFEVYDAAFWKNRNGRFNKVQNVLPEIDPLTIHFDGRNATKPDFLFLSPTIRYILDNASGEVLQKLFNTCKWFRASQPVNVCYKFKETDIFFDDDYDEKEPLKFVEQSIKSTNGSFSNTNIGQLFISKVLDFRSINPNALSSVIPRIYRCSAKYVEIYNQNLSLEELQFFIGNAVDLHLKNVKNSEGKEFKLESVLQLTPKIKRLIISEVEITNESFQNVFDLRYKFELIYFSNINLDLLDPVKFAEFVTKSCSYNTKIAVQVVSRINLDAFCDVFQKAMNEKWTGEEEKMPSVCFCDWIVI